jgi:LemA protein
VLDLQDEIERIEGMIADRRELYNDQVFQYNTRIAQLPALLLAPIFRWRPREFFAATPDETARPDTELRPA